MRWLLFPALIFLTSCSRHLLEVRSQYLYPGLLASQQVNTPDPCRDCFEGQEVIVRWKVPSHYFCDDLKLIATFRYGNRELGQMVVPLKRSWGFWTYRLQGSDYWNKCGLVAYKVDLCARDVVIYSWKHHVWSEIIEIRKE